MVSAGRCETGRVRRNNEDNIFIQNTPFGVFPNLYIVADGMGGHNAGEVASGMAIKSFKQYVLQQQGQEILDVMVGAFQYANEKVFEASFTKEEYMGMGTTFTVLVVDMEKLFCAHVGDSRLYRLNGGIVQITHDHSYVMEMVRNGELSLLEAENHPQKNVLTRALGVEKHINIDTYIEEMESPELLMCSDGLTNMLTDQEIYTIYKNTSNPCELTDRLFEAANQKGGYDNISVIVASAREVRA